ncbi:BFD domain-containing protein (2Fe-2S)-binding domain-containing protein (fragment) [Burkholderiales bacterium]|jgi:bacterioferritin-associated ferredoxin
MYVCICNAVTDQQIRIAVAAGARTIDDVGAALGVGAGCGCCRECAQEIIAGVRPRRTPAPGSLEGLAHAV